MANQEQLDLIRQGSDVWNVWKQQHDNLLHGWEVADLSGADLRFSDLSGADFSGTNLSGADLSGTNLSRTNLSRTNLSRTNLRGADFSGTNLRGADLSGQDLSNKDLHGADLSGTNLSGADLSGTNLSGADLSGTILSGADLSGANLSGQDLSNKNLHGADLSGANLSRTLLIGTNFTEATLTDCTIYGIAAWNVQLEKAIQKNLIITKEDEATITVDNLKVAQFIHLMLNNQEIRDVIETLTTRSVLILGRFTPERKAVLDALREALRKHNYLPILFDFDQPSTQTVRETVRTLAHLSHFVIADLTDASSIPEELETIVPNLAVAVQPLLEITQKREFSMFKDYGIYPWVLPIYLYTDLKGLLDNIQEKVIEPAKQKARELEEKKVHLNQEPFEKTT